MPIVTSIGVEIVGDGLDDRVFDSTAPWRGVAGLGRWLEESGVSYWVIGADRGEPVDPARVALDPSLVATVAARHTTALGLVVAAAAHRDHPYNLARRLVSVDHAAKGRVGWLALDFDHGIALNAATDTWTGAELEATHTADAVAAVRTLWRTWPLESIVGEEHTGLFADAGQIRRADVDRGYVISGPLNVPGSRQGDLPVWQHAAPNDPAATDDADLVVVERGESAPIAKAVVRVRGAEAAANAFTARNRDAAAEHLLLRLSPGELTVVLDEVLPAARRSGTLAPREGATLRDRLGVPLRRLPDMSTHAVAFSVAPTPGGRL